MQNSRITKQTARHFLTQHRTTVETGITILLRLLPLDTMTTTTTNHLRSNLDHQVPSINLTIILCITVIQKATSLFTLREPMERRIYPLYNPISSPTLQTWLRLRAPLAIRILRLRPSLTIQTAAFSICYNLALVSSHCWSALFYVLPSLYMYLLLSIHDLFVGRSPIVPFQH